MTLFEYWDMLGNAYPMAVEANKTELIVQSSSTAQIELLSKVAGEAREFQTWYSALSRLSKWENPIQYVQDFSLAPPILQNLDTFKTLSPLYLKKPNITLSTPSHGAKRP